MSSQGYSKIILKLHGIAINTCYPLISDVAATFAVVSKVWIKKKKKKVSKSLNVVQFIATNRISEWKYLLNLPKSLSTHYVHYENMNAKHPSD